MATITETRYISADRVRQMCIEENYFTRGTNDDYTKLLNTANSAGNVSVDLLYILAKNIYEHSEYYSGVSECDAISQIMYCLNKVCVTTYTIED